MDYETSQEMSMAAMKVAANDILCDLTQLNIKIIKAVGGLSCANVAFCVIFILG